MRTFYNLLRNLLLNSAKTQNETTNTTTKRMSFVSYLAVILLSVFGSMNMQGQTTLISPSGNGGFESAVPTGTPATDFTANGWTVVNNATAGTDKLFVGTVATPSLGTYSMFSGTSATSFVGQSPASVNHIYRDITFPAGESKITLTFKYKIPATDATYDYLKLWLVPTTTTPVAGTQLTTGQIGVTAGYDSSTTYVTQTVTIPASAAGTTQRLVFSWRTDGFAPGAVVSVDEISLVSAMPTPANAAPTNFTSTLVTVSGTTIGWTDNSTNETAFRVYRSTDGLTYTQVGSDIASTTTAGISTTYSSVQTGLLPGTTYYYRIAAVFEAESDFLTGTQATLTCPTFASTISIDGATAVPGTSYPTLTAAIADLKACGITQPTILELASGYVTETLTTPLTLSSIPGASAINTITIREALLVTGKVITSANTTATIDINGGNYWIIDGRSGGTGTKDLKISNTSTATGGTAIRFINEGSNNTIKYTTLSALFPSTTSGVVNFSTTTGANGNDNNTIQYCAIDGGAAATASPTLVAQNGVYSLGSTANATVNNSGNIISNNTIFNYFGAASTSAGISLQGGNTDWTIDANSFYQTNTRTATAAVTVYGITIANTTSGNNFIVTNNYIGGNTVNAGGTAWTVTGVFANRFAGIGLSVGATTASSVQGNTITNFSFISNSSATANSTSAPLGTGVWGGIMIAAGNANVGTLTGNVIGSTTGTGSISLTNSTNPGGTVNGIGVSGTGIVSISNNSIGSITTSGAAATISTGIIGIQSASTGTVTININTIGSITTANSLNASLASTGTTGQIVTGINNSGASTIAITNNTIANLNNAYVPAAVYTTGSILRGIVSSSGVNTITGNTVRNLTTAAQATGLTSSASVIGVLFTSTTATAASTVSQNTIYALSNTHGTSATSIAGIYFAGPTTTTLANVVAKNKIYNLNISTSSTSGDIRGLVFASGFATVQNNTIRLGYNADGSASIATGVQISGLYEVASTANSAIYHNTVYVGGTGVSNAGGSTYAFKSDSTTNLRSFQNNIFVNARSNTSAGSLTSKHFSVRLAISSSTLPVTGLTSNYNIYRATGTGGVFGGFGFPSSLDVADLAAWKMATGQDANSIGTDPCLAGPTVAIPDLHLTTCSGVGSPAESAGTLIASVTDDFEGQTRSTLSPVDIGADAGLYGPSGIEMAPVAIVSPAASGCKTNAETVSVSITNNNSQAINFATNNVTVTVTGTGVVAYNQFVVLNSGTLASGASQTVTMLPTIDMSANGAYALTASTSVDADLNTANDILPVVNYNLATLGGTYTVGTGGNYPTIAAAVTAYNAANCFTSNVLFSLTDALYDLGTTTTPLTINQNPSVGAYTLTIKPATGVTSTITGAIDTNAIFNIRANNIIIDGSNAIAGTTRNLTISNTSITSPNVVVIGSTGTTPITGVTLKNSIFINGVNSSMALIISNTALVAGYFNNITIQNNSIQKASNGIFAIATVATGNGSGLLITGNDLNTSGANSIRLTGIYVQGVDGATVTNNNIGNILNANAESPKGIWIASGTNTATISGNTISGISLTNTGNAAVTGIYINPGVTATSINVTNNTVTNLSNAGYLLGFAGIITFSPNTNVTYNTVSNLSQVSYSTYWGIAQSGAINSSCSYNTVTGLSNPGTTYTTANGINIQGLSTGLTIANNKVSNIKNNYTTGYYGVYGINLASTSAFSNIVLKNNMVWDLATYSYSTTLSYNAIGIYASAGGGYKIYNNSVYLGTQLSSTGTINSAAFGVDSVITTAGCLDVRNNIFVNNQTTSTTNCYAIYSGAASTVFASIDYNDYKVAGTNLGYIGSNRATLADIQAGFGGNMNSKSIAPGFLSNTDLHLNAGLNVTLDNLGTVLANVTDDIDGQTRSVSTPDMGADEFTTVYCAGQTAFLGAGTASPVQQCTSGSFTLNANAPQAVGLSFQWESATTATGPWTTIANATNFAYTTPTITATTFYHCLMTCSASGLTTTSDPITATIIPPPTIVITPSNGGFFCGSGTLTASGASNYTWSPVTNLFTDAAFTTAYVAGAFATIVYSNTTTNITYTATGTDSVTGCVNSTPIAVGPPVITLTSSIPNFCGTGGLVTLTASSPDSAMTYAWTSLTSPTVLDATTGSVVTSTIAATSDFKVIGTGSGTFTGCTSVAYASIGVYPLPSATVTTTANGVCPGTSATIGSGLVAGNFTVSPIPYIPYTVPTNATTIVTGGATTAAWPESAPTGGGSLDDGGWTGIPIGFNFNYFGTNFSSISAGTNGLLMFGAVPGYGTGAGQLGQYSFTTTPAVFPNTLNPANVIALMAGDQTLAGGSIKFWTEGYAPNRKFKLLYEGVPNCCSATNPNFTAYVILYETLGTVEIHILNKNNTNACTTGLQDSTRLIGAIAPGRQAFTSTITVPEAWRFSPPSNYTTNWYADGVLIPSTTTPAFTNPGTNVFNLTVAPAVTTTYSISYQNQTTGCSSVAGTNTQVLMAVLGNVAPLGVNTTSTSSTGSICAGTAVTFGTDFVGSPDGVTMQWQVSTDGGTSFTDITDGVFNLTLANPVHTYTTTPTVAGIYRCKITACNGVPSYSTNSPITFTYNITASAGATRCGTGTLDLTATGDGTAANSNKWYAYATSTVVLGTGDTFTTPSLNTTTTYYVGVKVGACTSIRTAVIATIIPAPTLTLSQTAIALCVGVPSSPVTITAGSTSYDSYVWSPTTGITGNETTGWIFNPEVTTSYTLTASQTGGQLCATTITVPVTVNVTPLSVTSSMDTLCEGGSSILTANPLVSGPQTAPTGYAASTATSTSDEDILNVTFGTLNSTSTCSSGNNLYTDNTSLTPPTFNTGDTVPISIQIGTCGTFNYSNFTNVFIDYNRDGVFDATTERVYSSLASTSGAHFETGNITIPSSASAGVTRMRVMNVEFGSATSSPSTSYSYGETEDYNINIQTIVPLSQTLTYAWTPAIGLSATTGGIVTASPTTTTIYTVTATNPSTGCTKSVSTTVNVNEVPQITGPSELCMPNTITLDNAVAHGVWSTSNPDVATVSETGVVSGVSSGTVTISYAVSFTNPVGCVITRTYTVTVNGPPTVVSYTQSQTILTNNNASFNVSATGSGLTYQWEVSNGSLPLTFAPITNTGIYAGATTNTLSLTTVGLAFNGYLYHCVISGIGSCTAATSTAAVLNVGDTGIASHPLNVSLCNTGNGTATYTVVAEGTILGYAWQVNTGTGGFTPITDSTVAGLNYSGTTSATLTVTGITVANSGWSFKCIISGPTNNPISNPATLTINQQLSFPTTLADQTVCYSGGVANYAVATLGTTSGYQWQYSSNGTTWNSVANGTPVGVTYNGATSNALTVNTTALTPVSGTYYYRAQAIAALPCADAYSNGARMYINNPTITTQAIDATVADGSSVNFTVVANATASTYQWQTASSLNGTYTNVLNDTPVGLTYLGDSTASLNVSTAVSTIASASNYYSVVVTSNGCSVTSTGALLTITNYCASRATSSSDEDITNVTFGTLNNATACASLAGSQGTATGTANLYSNFRAAVAPPVINAIGMTVPISVQVTECAGTAYFHQVNVYFDFNHNGLLTDSGEEFIIWAYASSNTHTINANITIPADASIGTTLMRVVCKESSSFGPCTVSSYGETEDYTVDLQPPFPCAGAPLAGTVSSTVSNICYAGTAVLNLTGYTSDLSGIGIRWEKSYDGANWTVIPGETSPQLATGTISQETVFHAVVTCANGNVSSTSDPYTISVDSPTVISVANAIRCGTGTVTLSAITENADSVKWYTSDTGGVAIATGNTFTTPIITATSGYYVEASTINCTSVRAQVIATVTSPPALALGSSAATICEGQTTPAIMVTVGNTIYDTFDWSSLESVSGDIVSGYTFNPTVTTTYTLTASQSSGTLCANTATFTVTVNPRPTDLTISPSPVSVCVNTAQVLTTTGGTLSNMTILNENFNSATNNWTTQNNSSGGSTALANWTLTADGTTYSFYSTWHSNDNSQFYSSNSDAQGSAGTTDTRLISPSFSTLNYTSANLSFWHYLYSFGGTGKVQYSTNGGSTWVNIITYSSTQGAPAAFANVNLALPAGALNRASVKLRFKYDDSWGYFWNIDNISITGDQTATMAWTPTTNLYTNAAATTVYTGQNVATVYVKSSAAGQTTYTASATSSFGCIRTATVDVTVNPDTTIALASGNATPTLCVNTAITDLVYSLGNELDATVTGLPIGVTGTYASGVFTISGTPTESGTFPFTVTATGLCLPASLSGTITVNPDTTIALTGGGALQTLCVNNAITDVVYGITNGTGANVTGLPTGVSGNYVAGVFTISGTPTVSGTFPFTVTTTGLCVQQSLSGTITVKPDTTLTWTSGSDAQTLCVNNAIANIVYAVANGTATVTGLPTGVSGTYASGVVTISGIPTVSGTFTYTVSTSGLCVQTSATGTFTVNPNTTLALTSGSTTQTRCINNAISNIVYTVVNGTGANVTGLPAGVSGNYVAGVFTISGTPSVSGTFPFTVTTTGLCVQQSLSGSITVNPDTTLTLTSGSDAQTLCVNNAIANIVYAVANGTATVTGLPTGVSGTYASGVVTISGIPTVSGTFTYTVSTSGLCVQTSATGTFTVNPTTTLVLTSGSVTQTRCINNAISNIVYTVGNGTGANVTGLPTGVTGNYAAGVFTLSGTPTVSGTFAYTVTPTGLCVISSLSGTITVNANTAITTQPVSQVACPRSSVTFVSGAIGVNLTYQWYFNGVAIANATSATYTIGFVNPSDAGIYTVVVSGGCSANVTSTQAFLAVQSVPAPTGTSVQTAVQGALLSSIVASGTNLTWYASVADAQAGINPLPLTYVLPVGTTTFYATQTVNGCQGYATLSVTMSVALGTKGFDLAALVYYPNPVTEMFNISYKLDIESVEVYNITGQRIMEVKPNMLETQIDMSALPTGTYMMLVKADGASKVIKVVKK